MAAYKPATVQPVIDQLGGLWYSEWFAGVDPVNWADPQAAYAADHHMLDTLMVHRHAIRGHRVGVNLAFLTVVHHGGEFVKQLQGLLPSGSVIEVTEHAVKTASAKEMDAFLQSCRTIREAGFALALDDCTEDHPYGDPTLWGMAQPAIIKADLRDSSAEKICARAKTNGRLSVMECVETKAQLDCALELAVDGLQGYYIGCPSLVAATFERALSA